MSPVYMYHTIDNPQTIVTTSNAYHSFSGVSFSGVAHGSITCNIVQVHHGYLHHHITYDSLFGRAERKRFAHQFQVIALSVWYQREVAARQRVISVLMGSEGKEGPPVPSGGLFRILH